MTNNLKYFVCIFCLAARLLGCRETGPTTKCFLDAGFYLLVFAAATRLWIIVEGSCTDLGAVKI